MTRKRELLVTLSGGFLCLFFLGGFALTILPMDEATYSDKVFPLLQGTFRGMSSAGISRRSKHCQHGLPSPFSWSSA
ncbi:hypothetical protein ACPJHQ_06405 [Rossellomorea sp. H39__3]